MEVSAGNYSTDYQYTYDANGNIATVTTGGKTTRYTYDTHNQLVREDNQAAGKTWTWTYDAGGNILSKKEYTYTTGTLGSPTSTKTYTYGDAQWGDKLTAYNGTAITYDPIGNPLSDGEWSYTWEHGRQLASMTEGSTNWAYSYDTDGLRTQRTNGSDTYEYFYSNGVLKSMNVGTAKLVFDYDANGLPLTLTYKVGDGDEMVYCFVTNLQGDVMAIMDGGGNTIVAYTYDAWGRVLTTTGTLATSLGQINPLRYRGYVYDQETGLYYLQSRYYNPTWGRFLNADVYISTGQGFVGCNMFAYCVNNPVNFRDNKGEYADSYAGMAGGAIGEFLYELFSGGTHPSRQTQQLETEIIMEQNKMAGNAVKTVGDVIGSAAEAVWDAYMRGYQMQQEAQLLEAQLVLNSVNATYRFLDETETISVGKYGWHTAQAFNEGRKALVYFAAPIPTLTDEFLAAGHAVKMVYHLFLAGMEVFQ